MKVLFVSHVANFQKFNNPFIRWFKAQGWSVHYASLDDEPITDADVFHKISFRRSPYNPQNTIALFQLISLLRREKFDLVHCHTPVGGILTRMASVFCPKTKIIYTAHGFHFFKNAPRKNFLVYRTAEKMLARRTDALVTINEEDYAQAQSFRLRKNGRLYRIHGVGVNTEAAFSANPDREKLRSELGISSESFVVLTVAEMIVRKNYPTALKAFAQADIPNSVYLICGSGTEKENISALAAQLGISDRVVFAGYRRDIYDINKISDVFLFTSSQEGLPVAVMEAMACGLTVVASKIRGNNELVTDNGILCDRDDVGGFAEALRFIHKNTTEAAAMGARGIEAIRPYSTENAVKAMAEIYESVCGSQK